MTRSDPLDVPRPDAQLHFGVFFQGVNHWTIWSAPDSGSQINLLVPELQERGLYRTDYTGTTLRDHLGLREPLPHRSPPDHRQAG
jgi:hypothetical protein